MNQETVDIEEIRALCTKYSQLLDDLRMDEWGELFCEDAEWIAGDFRFTQRSEIVRGVGALEPKKPGLVRHLAFAPVVEIDGDGANCWADAIALRVGSISEIVSVGRYHDVLRREGGRWRFARRLFVFSGAPVPPGVRPAPP